MTKHSKPRVGRVINERVETCRYAPDEHAPLCPNRAEFHVAVRIERRDANYPDGVAGPPCCRAHLEIAKHCGVELVGVHPYGVDCGWPVSRWAAHGNRCYLDEPA